MPSKSKPLFLAFPDDYAQRLEDLERAARLALNDKTPLTTGEADPYETLAAEHAELKAAAEAAADEAGFMVVFDSIGRQLMRKLKARYPARDDRPEDRMFGADMESMQDDLVHAMLSSPASASCAKDQAQADQPCGEDNPCSRRQAFEEWADSLGYGEWNVTAVSATEHLIAVAADPKDLPSLPTTSGGSMSASPTSGG